MRLADIAIDLVAVVKASRSVAAKHAALRSRQFDLYNRTSGAADGLRRRSQPPYGNKGYEQAHEIYERGKTEKLGDEVSADQGAKEQRSDLPQSLGSDGEPLTNENGSEGIFGGHGISEEAISSRVKPDGVPPGINIDVFRTNRGSKILGALDKERQRGPAQYPAPWSGLGTTPAVPEVGKAEGRVATGTGRIPETTKQPKSGRGPETTTPDVEPPAVPTAAEEESLPNPLGGPKPYILRESKVPATRLSRMWNYSGLAASMLGGAVSEGLSRTFGGGGEGSVMLSGANMERLVTKLSRMRGAALKLGQMMSFQDSKMLPGPIQEVLQRVQDRADYMPSYQRDQVLVSNLGDSWRDLFSDFEEKPIAAASIGQVHRATLQSGKQVAVKIQFPGVAASINSDLDNLSMLLTATKLLPKGLYLERTIANARTELGWECDYEREADCLTRFKSLMVGEESVFRVPGVHPEASGKQVLTMDFMEGVGVTRVASFAQPQRDWIGTQIMRLCLREITEFRFMQTDPNWTNFLYNAKLNKLELLDFGASREYPDRFVDLYVRLLEAASRGDRHGVKVLSEDLGYLTGHESRAMLDAHVDSVLTLAEPFVMSAPDIYDFKDQTITERVKDLIPVMLRERLAPPPEETYSLHRKLSGAFLLCARLGSKVPCRELFAKSLDRAGIPRGNAV
jgi:aarF domain-containing kinase